MIPGAVQTQGTAVPAQSGSEFLYLSKAHARAKAYMESTIWFTDGFVVITGEIGCGKTTLIETFLRELENDVIVAQINQTQVSSIEFLQSVLVQFGFKPFKHEEGRAARDAQRLPGRAVHRRPQDRAGDR